LGLLLVELQEVDLGDPLTT